MNRFLALLLLLAPSAAHAVDYFDCENGVAGAKFDSETLVFVYNQAQERTSLSKDRSHSDQYSSNFRGSGEADFKSGKDSFEISTNGVPSICRKISGERNATTIDLTQKGFSSTEPKLSSYSEYYSQPVITAFSQQDIRLSKYFDADGLSQLCVPSALAQGLLFLRTTNFPNLRVGSTLLSGSTVDSSRLINELAFACRTDSKKGTDIGNAVNCLANIFHRSGYGVEKIKLISELTEASKEQELPEFIYKKVGADDIREYLQKGYAVMAYLEFYQQNPSTQKWENAGMAHTITITGYHYRNAWNSKIIELEMVDPARTIPGANPVENFTLVEGKLGQETFPILYGHGATDSYFTMVLKGLLVYQPY